MSATDQSHTTSETEQAPVAVRPAQTRPLLFDRRAPLSERQTLQYEGTEIEIDPKPDQLTSDVNLKENVVPVVWR